jgi:hypothetical protein
MNPNPDPRESIPGQLTPEELALLADYHDGALGPSEVPDARALLARSDAAREVLAETSELLGRHPAPDVDALPWSARPSTPRGEPDGGMTHLSGDATSEPSPRMGWRSFLPLAAAGVGVIALLFWPKGESLDLLAWSTELAGRDSGDSFPFVVLRGGDTSPDVAETAGIRWVELRIALAAGRQPEVDSLARVLADDLRNTPGSGSARARLDALAPGDLPRSEEQVDATERALIDMFGADFEEAAVLETLRRAAGAGAGEMVRDLVEHSALSDGEGKDVDEDDLTRLVEMCEGSLTDEEFAEMEAIVTGILRRRT